MDLICPTCQKRLTIEDRYAGMVVKCPLCSAMLQAPTLRYPAAPSPAPIPPVPQTIQPPSAPEPPPKPDTQLKMPAPAPTPAAAAAPISGAQPLDVAEVLPKPTEPTAIRAGEFGKLLRWHLRPDILEWLIPGCVAAIFLLSLFTWYFRESYAINLWELAFTERGESLYTFYTVVFMFLTLPVTAIALILEKGWLPLPDGLRPIWPFRTLIVGGLIALPFVFFFYDYVAFQFLPFGVQAAIAMKLAFRIHLLAVVACALQYWLQRRRTNNRPLPRITIRW